MSISASITISLPSGVYEPVYNTTAYILSTVIITINTSYVSSSPVIGDIVIDSQCGSIWRITETPTLVSGTTNKYNIPSLYLLNHDDFLISDIESGNISVIISGTLGNIIVSPIDNKLSIPFDSLHVNPDTVRIASKYNAAQGGVKVIKVSTNTTINLESKIILDMTGFPDSTAGPSLSLILPDYTHFNAGHTIEFFDAASKFDTRNVQISAATGQKINTNTTPILLDITYSTIKFIYSGDSTIGWVF